MYTKLQRTVVLKINIIDNGLEETSSKAIHLFPQLLPEDVVAKEISVIKKEMFISVKFIFALLVSRSVIDFQQGQSFSLSPPCPDHLWGPQ
jgi:hypothetical protein